MERVTTHEGNSADIVQANIQQMKGIFPEAFTEDGINFDVLRQLLGDAGVLDEGEEKFGLNWHGKKKARQIALTPSTGTLRPCPEESVNWDTTKNLFIEGDNLEVLKLLQKSYAGCIKMIYIDPPYNTGKDFIYPDNYQDNLDTYLRYTGQKGEDGLKLSSNTESSGRYHTNWLNMMYPRLKLARNLLKDNGIMFISIGDNEGHNLKKICDEIFGEENFCAQFIWNTEGNTDNQYEVKVNHEYILAYYKRVDLSESTIGRVIDPNTPIESNLWKGIADNNINKNNPANPPSIVEIPAGFPCSEETLFYPAKRLDDDFFSVTAKEKYISDAIKEKYGIESKSGLPVKLDDMVVENFKLVKPCRIYVGMANKNKLLEFINNGCNSVLDDGAPISFYINANAAVRYNKANERPRNILSVLRNMGTTEKTRTYLRKMGIHYDYPKPLGLLQHLIKIGCEEDNGVVLDFFSGSSTICEAIYTLNEASVKRTFIVVQLPENLESTSEAYKAGFKTISELGKERIRRAGKQIQEENPNYQGDLGFKVFKLASSNIRAWDPDASDMEQTLLDHVEHLVPGRSEQDVLYELLLKRGVDLSTPIESQTVAGKTVYSIGYGVLFACLSPSIAREEVEELAAGIVAWHEELQPATDTHLFFRDSAFADDVTKTNLSAILHQHGISHVRSL